MGVDTQRFLLFLPGLASRLPLGFPANRPRYLPEGGEGAIRAKEVLRDLCASRYRGTLCVFFLRFIF